MATKALSIDDYWGLEWKAEGDHICEQCGDELPTMDCAELGDLCSDCFPQVMEEHFGMDEEPK